MGHYFTNEETKSNPNKISYTFKGKDYIFHSDNGVFSKNAIDYGSRVLIDTVDLKDASTLLDIGCGYGTMGIMLKGSAKNPLKVTMCDVNLKALELAKKNILANNINDIEIIESDIYNSIDKTYDLIISNPPIRAGKKVVHTILEKAYDHLNDNGRLVIVIQKKQGAPSAKEKMQSVFNNCEILKRDKGYFILQSYKNAANK